ncbi:MAG: FumA C-terminus/TtdB family hydratase beta subunit [Oscillospiraceae bacterium]|jgi:L(+)-tartrate dehydratase beta subunit|nr:FumA C-terminus/TtdB family hydratase beta subunit [Oscillospiraceae bacterium]
MARYLETPINRADLENIAAGDTVYLNGLFVTARDSAHERLVSGAELPIDLKGAGLYHAGPIVRQSAIGWELVAMGPTTSMRMEKLETEFIRRTGVKIIIGKGGMGGETAAACREFGCVHAVYTGGCGVLAAEQARITGLYWDDLGMAEAVWVCRAENFGPLVVSIDSKGNNFFEANKDLYRRNKARIFTAFAGDFRALQSEL